MRYELVLHPTLPWSNSSFVLNPWPPSLRARPGQVTFYLSGQPRSASTWVNRRRWRVCTCFGWSVSGVCHLYRPVSVFCWKYTSFRGQSHKSWRQRMTLSFLPVCTGPTSPPPLFWNWSARRSILIQLGGNLGPRRIGELGLSMFSVHTTPG